MVISTRWLRLPGWLLAAGGMAMIANGWIATSQRFRDIASWRITDGRVLSSVAHEPAGVSPARAEYELWYTVGNAMYTEKFTSLGPTYDDVSQRVAKHPAGDIFPIAYNPANPRQTDPNIGYNAPTLSGGIALIAHGVALILIAMIFLLFGRKPADPL
jgi:hypothetical protein